MVNRKNTIFEPVTKFVSFVFLQERQQFHLEQLRAAEFRARSAAQQQLTREQNIPAVQGPAGQAPAVQTVVPTPQQTITTPAAQIPQQPPPVVQQ